MIELAVFPTLRLVEAYAGDRMIGWLTWWRGRSQDAWVDPAYRRLGIARAMLRAAEQAEGQSLPPTHLTADGAAFAAATGGVPQDAVRVRDEVARWMDAAAARRRSRRQLCEQHGIPVIVQPMGDAGPQPG